jgi:hypothetical protein
MFPEDNVWQHYFQMGRNILVDTSSLLYHLQVEKMKLSKCIYIQLNTFLLAYSLQDLGNNILDHKGFLSHWDNKIQ